MEATMDSYDVIIVGGGIAGARPVTRSQPMLKSCSSSARASSAFIRPGARRRSFSRPMVSK
jgi:hypothetical protein